MSKKSAPRPCSDAVMMVHRQAIQVVYHGPTNHRGSCYVAKCSAVPRGLRHPYDHALNPDENAAAACRALIVHMGWDVDITPGTPTLWVGSTLADGSSVFVPLCGGMPESAVRALASAPVVGTVVHARYGSSSRTLPLHVASVVAGADDRESVRLYLRGAQGGEWVTWAGWGAPGGPGEPALFCRASGPARLLTSGPIGPILVPPLQRSLRHG